MNNVIEVYTDGSTVDNNNVLKGNGWAFIIPELGIEMSGKSTADSTTARMELQGVIKALEYIASHKGSYVIYCDSISTVHCFKGLGARKLYKDLWESVYDLIMRITEQGSVVDIEFLERSTLDKNSDTFKHSQRVDRLAYIQANRLL